MDRPRIHPREHQCREAALELTAAVARVIKSSGLTEAETLLVIDTVLSREILAIARGAILEERQTQARRRERAAAKRASLKGASK